MAETGMQHRARLVLRADQLRDLIGLPDDVQITAVRVDLDPVRLDVYIQCPRFDLVADENEAPIINHRWMARRLRADAASIGLPDPERFVDRYLDTAVSA